MVKIARRSLVQWWARRPTIFLELVCAQMTGVAVGAIYAFAFYVSLFHVGFALIFFIGALIFQLSYFVVLMPRLKKRPEPMEYTGPAVMPRIWWQDGSWGENQ